MYDNLNKHFPYLGKDKHQVLVFNDVLLDKKTAEEFNIFEFVDIFLTGNLMEVVYYSNLVFAPMEPTWLYVLINNSPRYRIFAAKPIWEVPFEVFIEKYYQYYKNQYYKKGAMKWSRRSSASPAHWRWHVFKNGLLFITTDMVSIKNKVAKEFEDYVFKSNISVEELASLYPLLQEKAKALYMFTRKKLVMYFYKTGLFLSLASVIPLFFGPVCYRGPAPIDLASIGRQYYPSFLKPLPLFVEKHPFHVYFPYLVENVAKSKEIVEMPALWGGVLFLALRKNIIYFSPFCNKEGEEGYR